MKSYVKPLLAALALLLITACTFFNTFASPTEPAPNLTLAIPSSIATTTPTPANAASPVELIQTKMIFWDTWFSYDSNIWLAAGDSNVPSITHRQIPNCIIYEQGPTEPPEVTKTVDLGQVQYNVAEIFQDDLHADWYMAASGPRGPFKEGLPTLIVKGSSDNWDMCLTNALTVLATLTDSNP